MFHYFAAVVSTAAGAGAATGAESVFVEVESVTVGAAGSSSIILLSCRDFSSFFEQLTAAKLAMNTIAKTFFIVDYNLITKI